MTYANPEGLSALAVVFLSLSTTLILLRVVTIRSKRQTIGYDDAALLVSWLLSTGLNINIITAVATGFMGRELPPPVNSHGHVDAEWGYSAPIAQLDKFVFAHEVMLPFQLACAKLSIILFYRRTLVSGRYGFTHWATLFALVLTGIWGSSFFFVTTFQCGSRFSLYWDGPTAIENKYCVSNNKDLVFATSDLALDLIVMLLPLYRIFTLKISKAKKVQVACGFMMGTLSVLGASVRLAVYLSLKLGIFNDFTAVYPTILDGVIVFWGAFEAGFSVTTASLLGLRPFFNQVAEAFGQRLISWKGSSGGCDSPTSDMNGSIFLKEEYELNVERV